jgi:sialidase-1
MTYNLRAAFAAPLLFAASITPSAFAIGQSNAAEPIAQSVVYQPGEEGYSRYRIPAVVQTKQGTLLAFCEGRTGGDSGPIDLVLKRSSDNGQTWGPLQVVWDDGDNTCGNPCPVVDQQTGTIWLLMTWNLGTDHERAIMDGTSKDLRHVYVTHSKDDGLTWATPTKISDTTRRSHWRWYATGPGNAIQLTRGAHAGRLLIPANHSDHDNQGHPYRSHVIYSDDHGETWELGGIQQDKTNESAIVELGDGSVLHAMRSYHGKNRRAMAISENGGETWGDVYLDDALDTPVCQASIVRYSWPNEASDGKSRILFASPRGKERSQMTVWMSYDEGKTWPIHKLIDPGSAAYSNLIPLANDHIGLLYERDNYRSITFAKFALAWLEQ